MAAVYSEWFVRDEYEGDLSGFKHKGQYVCIDGLTSTWVLSKKHTNRIRFGFSSMPDEDAVMVRRLDLGGGGAAHNDYRYLNLIPEVDPRQDWTISRCPAWVQEGCKQLADAMGSDPRWEVWVTLEVEEVK